MVFRRPFIYNGKLQRAGDFDDVEAFQLVAFHNFVVAFDHQAALEAHADFFDVVFVAFQRRQFAGVDDHVVADEADMGIAFDHAVGNHTACDVADFGYADDLTDFDHTGNLLFLFRRQHAAHGCFDVVDGIVNDVVVADFHVFIFGKFARRSVCTHVKADDERA